MPKFNVYATVTGGKYLGEFEADTEAQAIAMAEQSDAAYVSLCHKCGVQCEDAECTDFRAEKSE